MRRGRRARAKSDEDADGYVERRAAGGGSVSVWADDVFMLGEPPAGDGKLGDKLAVAIAEHGPSSGSDLALRVGAWTRWDVTALYRLEIAGNRLGTDASRQPTVLVPPTVGDAQNVRKRA